MVYYYSKKELTMKKISAFQYAGIFLLLLFIGSSLGFSGAISTNLILEKVPIIIRPNQEKFNSKQFKQLIYSSKCKFPEIIWKQAILESNNFKSPIFIKGNNVFGMKVAKSRTNTQISNINDFATYSSPEQSLADLFIWQSLYAQDILNEEEYYLFLDKIYCKDINQSKTYSQMLKSIK